MGERVLLIEDDSRLAAMVSEYLGKAGFHVVHAETGARGLALHGREPADVVILDLMLPDGDGLDICRQMRARSDSPILMLTARGDPMDRVVGLEMGADDYLPKPFEPRELLARLRAILRRRHAGPRPDILRHGRIEIDRGSREVRLDGLPRPLTGYQFALLLALAEHAGRVMSRDAVMNAVKGEQFEAFDRSIDVHVSRIRPAFGPRSRTIPKSRGASSPSAARATFSPRPRTEGAGILPRLRREDRLG